MRKGAYVALFVLLLLVIEVGATIFQPLGRKRVETAVPVVLGDSMIVVWKTTLTTQQVVMPYRTFKTYNCKIVWGDGTATSTVTGWNDADATHQYAVAGTYTSTISGQQEAWYFRDAGSKAQFMGVNQWGYLTNSTVGLERAFDGCNNATHFASPIDSRWGAVASLFQTFTSCWVASNFPSVSALTNVTSLAYTWGDCFAATNFPTVSNLTKATTFAGTWYYCTNMQNTVQSLLGDCSWITGQVKNVSYTFYGCRRLKGNGMPLVTAITNSPGYPTGYTITDCFQDCTNLTDWATIPAAFK